MLLTRLASVVELNGSGRGFLLRVSALRSAVASAALAKELEIDENDFDADPLLLGVSMESSTCADEAEIREMAGWLRHLGDSFPAAVALVVRSPARRIEHGQLLFEVRESDLGTRFSTETAEFLIYLCNSVLATKLLTLE